LFDLVKELLVSGHNFPHLIALGSGISPRKMLCGSWKWGPEC
jgi:hypothetical protein